MHTNGGDEFISNGSVGGFSVAYFCPESGITNGGAVGGDVGEESDLAGRKRSSHAARREQGHLRMAESALTNLNLHNTGPFHRSRENLSQ